MMTSLLSTLIVIAQFLVSTPTSFGVRAASTCLERLRITAEQFHLFENAMVWVLTPEEVLFLRV